MLLTGAGGGANVETIANATVRAIVVEIVAVDGRVVVVVVGGGACVGFIVGGLV